MLMAIVAVAFGGALGSIARFLTVTSAMYFLGLRFPYGTFLVNSLGSFLAGIVMVLVLERWGNSDFLRLFLMVGFMGGYTTFSSFAWETWALYESGTPALAFLNVFLNNTVAIGLAFLGIQAGRMIAAS